MKDALFDASIAGSFDVVVTNPPYLSARNLDPKVVRRLKSRFPSGSRAIITPASCCDRWKCFVPAAGWESLPCIRSCSQARLSECGGEIAELADIRTVAHFGPGLFDVGNPGTLQTAAIVLRRKPALECTAEFSPVVDASDKRSALAKAIASSAGRSSSRFELTQSDLASLPRSAWMYWISPENPPGV